VTSEYFVEAACRDEIIRREASTTPFLAKKGDVLIWHAALMHRAGAPRCGP
jgi:ectoine hydroxylase-related dioxygenase (phytanoyl-CoA dioxygenase family)